MDFAQAGRTAETRFTCGFRCKGIPKRRRGIFENNLSRVLTLSHKYG